MNWKDTKYLLAYVAPLAAFAGIYLKGAWSFGAVYLGFIIIPLLELVLPFSQKNLTEREESSKANVPFFDWLLYLNIPILFLLLWYFFSTVVKGGLQTYELVGMTLNVGIIIGTVGINVAHELGHRSKKIEQLLSKLLLMTALYMHFFIEHNRGHHKNVSTDEDPASARFGENLYAFWVRSTMGSYINAWKLEAERLQKNGNSFLNFQNEMIVFQLIQMGYLIAVGLLFGWKVIPFAIAIPVAGFLLLETVNYIEHYGLRREKFANGRYENVSMKHSWNSDHELGRIFLYELTRHSDHHYKSTRKYQVLRHFDESPQLPFGYPSAMLLSLVPPVWFKVMNKHVHANA